MEAFLLEFILRPACLRTVFDGWGMILMLLWIYLIGSRYVIN